LKQDKLRELLISKAEEYNNPQFIESDPISIPHQFSLKEDREISGFLAATIAWGQRPTIIANALKMVELMDHAPYEFIMNHLPKDRLRFMGFVHRTFNYDDLNYFLFSLQHIYRHGGGLEQAFAIQAGELNPKHALGRFRETFFSHEHLSRTQKHVSDPFKNSSCKRLNMYLRWMVRRDDKGVDLGLWKDFKMSQLSCPLDVHSGTVARKLGLLTRKQNDWKAVEELDSALRLLDPEDPVKFDFALFGMGVFEGFGKS
jgi:uncharacterized protein (TIGR02757 family)